MNPKEVFGKFLLKQLGTQDLVKDFVKTYRVFDIDVGDVRTIDFFSKNNEVLLSMIALHEFGVARKLADIKNKIKQG